MDNKKIEMSIQSAIFAEEANKIKDKWVNKLKESLKPRSSFIIITYSQLVLQVEEVIKEIEEFQFSE